MEQSAHTVSSTLDSILLTLDEPKPPVKVGEFFRIMVSKDGHYRGAQVCELLKEGFLYVFTNAALNDGKVQKRYITYEFWSNYMYVFGKTKYIKTFKKGA